MIVPVRLDKFLKVSRIIKRRTVANEACAGGRVEINGRVAKPGADIKPGDRLTIRFGEHIGVSIQETVRTEEAEHLYRILEEDAAAAQERA